MHSAGTSNTRAQLVVQPKSSITVRPTVMVPTPPPDAMGSSSVTDGTSSPAETAGSPLYDTVQL